MHNNKPNNEGTTMTDFKPANQQEVIMEVLRRKRTNDKIKLTLRSKTIYGNESRRTIERLPRKVTGSAGYGHYEVRVNGEAKRVQGTNVCGQSTILWVEA